MLLFWPCLWGLTLAHQFSNNNYIYFKNHGFKYIVTTKGKNGISIVGKNIAKHIKSKFIKNPDVTGAGDTVIAALSIAYAKTQDIEFSVNFANSAAAIAVSKSGTATAELEEIDKLLTK